MGFTESSHKLDHWALVRPIQA